MATKIIDGYDLSEGSVLSSAITDVGTIVLQAKISGATSSKKVKISILAKEGDSDYDPVRNENNDEINFSIYGNGGYRMQLNSVNAENIKIQATVESGAVGTLTVEYTKEANALT